MIRSIDRNWLDKNTLRIVELPIAKVARSTRSKTCSMTMQMRLRSRTWRASTQLAAVAEVQRLVAASHTWINHTNVIRFRNTWTIFDNLSVTGGWSNGMLIGAIIADCGRRSLAITNKLVISTCAKNIIYLLFTWSRHVATRRCAASRCSFTHRLLFFSEFCYFLNEWSMKKSNLLCQCRFRLWQLLLLWLLLFANS